MKKFIIAVEVDLDAHEASNPQKWMENIIGSVRMRRVGNINCQEVPYEIKIDADQMNKLKKLRQESSEYDRQLSVDAD